MRSFIFLFLFSSFCFGINYEDIEINPYGETNYSKKDAESLRTTLHFDYKIKLFEPSHKKYMLHFGGTISPDYDHFGRTMKVNGFTGFGIDF
jgi:hypothetical protein